jgi:hypothetical protein
MKDKGSEGTFLDGELQVSAYSAVQVLILHSTVEPIERV